MLCLVSALLKSHSTQVCDEETFSFFTGESGFLIFANRQDIRRLLFDSSDYTEMVPEQRGAIALDYDFESGYIFWTDVIDENIRRTKMYDSSIVEDLVKINLHTPDGIAVDWINKKLYWTDTGVDMIEVSDFDGKNRLQLVTTNLEEPRAIVVHPSLGYVEVNNVVWFFYGFLFVGILSYFMCGLSL